MSQNPKKSFLKSNPPKILFEDNHLVVLSKPAGLLSQGDISEEENLVDYLRDYFGRHYVGLVHRLDRNTSGLMVVAKRTKSANRLTEAIRKRDVKRLYQAVLYGTLKQEEDWTHYLKKDEAQNLVKVCSEKTSGAKKSELHVTPIKTFEKDSRKLTLAEFELKTGRSHQIRVQSLAAGYPLVGDAKYLIASDRNRIHFPRPALHAVRITFPHPMSGEVLTFEDTLAQDIQNLLD